MIKTALIFQDHMILQREKPVRIWGTCEPGQEITVTMSGESVTTAGKADGTWIAQLPSFPAVEDTEMSISSGEEEILFRHVAIGEVWLAGGQSNMEFYLRYDRGRKHAVENKRIRMFDYPKVSYEGQIDKFDYSEFGFWRTCEEKNFDYFSAAAYYFAVKLEESYDVPIGIVGCTWGGTPACTWMDPEYLRDNEGRAWLEAYEEAVKELDENSYDERFDQNPENYKGKPFENIMLDKMMYGMTPEEFQAWMEELQDQPETAAYPAQGPKSEQRPGGLYETMLKKLVPYAIKGFLWYQGENDDVRYGIYDTVFSNLIQCWRDLWKEELPFLFVQLAPFRYWMPEGSHIYPELREKQEWVSKHVPGCWMASVMDAGMEGDIHPKNKKPVGERLALLAMGHVYGENLLCDAPECTGVRKEDGKIRIEFAYAGEGLHVSGDTVNALEVLINGEAANPESVTVRDDTMILTISDMIRTDKVDIRFAKQDYCEVNLYNSADIAAKPFQVIL